MNGTLRSAALTVVRTGGFLCFGLVLVLALTLAGAVRVAAAQTMTGGARAASLGGATTALMGDPWARSNPASGAELGQRIIAFHASQAFGLSQLRVGAVRVIEPVPFGVFALGAQTFGFEAYREVTIELGFSRTISIRHGEDFAVGVMMHYYQVRIPEYGRSGTAALTLGWIAPLHPTFHVGFEATNINAPRITETDDLARTYAMGVSYLPDPALRVVADVLKDVRFPLSVRAGLEYQAVSVLFLRTGITTEPTRFTAGAGIRVGNVMADVAGEHHAALGWSPGVSLGLRW